MTEAILANLRDLVAGDGGKFAVVIVPAREQVYPEEWQGMVDSNLAMQSLSWNLEFPNQILTQILARQKIPYLDLLPAFRLEANQSTANRLYFVHDGHWTEVGHALAAETIFTFLYEENLVK